MADRTKSFAIPAAITLGSFFAVIIAASVVSIMGEDGTPAVALFLLVMASPPLLAAGAAITVWRLMKHFSSKIVAAPERILFAFAAFVTTCGSGPLAISGAAMTLARREGYVGAAPIWAFASIAVSTAALLSGTALILARRVLGGRT